MVINGEYTQDPPVPVSDSCHYAWEYVICSPSESLYKFCLKEEVLKEFESVVEKADGILCAMSSVLWKFWKP